MLGLTDDQAQELFFPTDLVEARNRGTKAHARATIAHIRRFQKANRKQLKTTPVAPKEV